MKLARLSIMALIGVVLFAFVAQADVPEINTPVNTPFGTYTPVPVVVSPQAWQFVVDPNLANVENRSSFTLTPAQTQLLSTRGFFYAFGNEKIVNSGIPDGFSWQNFADIYTANQDNNVPPYITSDVMLHAFHRLFDYSLRRTEEVYLSPTLQNMTTQVLGRIQVIHDASSDPAVVEATRLAGTYLAVGLRLLNANATVPAWVEPDLSRELALIENHAGQAVCPLFGAFKEDYSQYVPRGHYTRSEELKRYFKAMMWFGRMAFVANNNPSGNLVAVGRCRGDLTAAAILLLRELDRNASDGTPAEKWSKIWQPTVFFVGYGDDLTPIDYRTLAASVYGAEPALLSPEQICDPTKLETFMNKVQTELPNPKIRSLTPKGMRLFPQRFIPDSWYLSELTSTAVLPTATGEYRLMPSSLDVFSVLGSIEAEALQRQSGEYRFPNYGDQLDMLRADVDSGGAERWAATLYWNWIYTLEPLLRIWDEGFPPFMRDAAWPRRQLAGAAGSWTELRHDTILYAKQSGSPTGGPPQAKLLQGYVEPNPWLFARLAALAAYAQQGLDGFGVLDSSTKTRLGDMETASRLLADIASKELERKPIPNSSFLFMHSFGKWLFTLLDVEEGKGDFSNPNDRAPVVADVHTDLDHGKVLEVGTGYPGQIFVVADVEGRLLLCVGAVFVPFEFHWPSNDRLTDEKWWTMLAENPPEVPWWTKDLYHSSSVPKTIWPVTGSMRSSASKLQVLLEQDTVMAGTNLVLNSTTRPSSVELRPSKGSTVTIPIAAGQGSIALPTVGLPPGSLTVVVKLTQDGSACDYALRATLTPLRSTRRAIRR